MAGVRCWRFPTVRFGPPCRKWTPRDGSSRWPVKAENGVYPCPCTGTTGRGNRNRSSSSTRISTV